MKNPVILSILISSFLLLTDSVKAQEQVKDSVIIVKDGIYEGTSRAKYTGEPYWGIVRLTIKNGLIDNVSFAVRDSNLHEYFDGSYEKHFAGNDVYINQSRNDWAGVQVYPKRLHETQDLKKVDAISGATWSYNIFKASVNEALKNPK